MAVLVDLVRQLVLVLSRAEGGAGELSSASHILVIHDPFGIRACPKQFSVEHELYK